MDAHTRPTITKDVRVALLTNSLSPHTLPLCEGINARVGEFCAFVSASSDTFHDFPRPTASFRIVVQRSLNAFRLRHRTGNLSISEQLHLPLDTLPQLFRYRPDVILSGQFGARTLFAVLYRMVRPRVRLILWAALSSHTEQKRSRLRTALRRWIVRHVDGAFVNGKSGEEYLRTLGFAGAMCTVPYTIDGTLFHSPGYEPQDAERKLLFCGRLDATKGIRRFTEVLRRWCVDHPDRRVRFEVIGNGPDLEPMQRLDPVPNLTVCLLPRMEQSHLAAHYKTADIFAFPSLMDEWGVVVNEAMCARLPVLGSIYSQAVLELVQDGTNGWIFDSADEARIYSTLDRALTTSTDQLRRMSAHAFNTISSISPEHIADRVVESIASVCGAEHSPAGRARSAESSLAPARALPLP